MLIRFCSQIPNKEQVFILNQSRYEKDQARVLFFQFELLIYSKFNIINLIESLPFGLFVIFTPFQ